MSILTQPITFDQWAAMPDDGKMYELRNGVLVEMTAPSVNHGLVVSALHLWLGRAESAGYGIALTAPIAVLLDPTTKRQNALQPDVLFIRSAREHILQADVIAGVPDLLIEVLSPNTRDDDLPLGEKWRLYQDFAVPHYWIVDLDHRSVTQYASANGAFGPPVVLGPDDTLTSPLFPTITTPVAALFRRLRTA